MMFSPEALIKLKPIFKEIYQQKAFERRQIIYLTNILAKRLKSDAFQNLRKF